MVGKDSMQSGLKNGDIPVYRLYKMASQHPEGHNRECEIPLHVFFLLRDWSLIRGGGGATKWENRGSETFCATPSRQGKTFRAPPFKEWKLYAPPLQYG